MPAGIGRLRNLIKVLADGSVAWRGELPGQDPTDAFVALATDPDGTVLAATWSGYRAKLDPHTGRLKSAEFTE